MHAKKMFQIIMNITQSGWKEKNNTVWPTLTLLYEVKASPTLTGAATKSKVFFYPLTSDVLNSFTGNYNSLTKKLFSGIYI